MLNITKGNVVPMHAILMIDDEIFPVINAENVEVYIQGVFQRYECIHHVEESEDNVVYLEAPDTLPTGVYGVEVKGKMNDVPWRTYTKDVLKITYATEKGDNEPVVPSSDTYDITMEVQLYKTASSDEKIKKHNQDHEAHPYIQDLISEIEGKIPVLPEHIVTDEDYVHTDNNFTTEEKEKLRGLENYDDAEVRGLIAQKQDVIPDLATIRSGAAKGATAYQKPSGGITYNDLSDDVQTDLALGSEAWADLHDVSDGLLWKVPAQASRTNQLADKDFVNSSISTNTAYYISNNGQPFTSLAQLQAYSGPLTNNDYAFVVGTDAAGNTIYTRYKYNADTQAWSEEYVLNNSSFTAAQWAAINSAITSGDVEKLAALPTKEQLDALLAAKQDTLTFDNLPTQNSNNPVKSGGVFTALDSKADMVRVYTHDFGEDAPEVLGIGKNTIMEVTFVNVMSFDLDLGVSTEKCEYCIKFDVATTIPTLSLPSEIRWAEDIELEANTHYVILISYENGRFYGDWKSYHLT